MSEDKKPVLAPEVNSDVVELSKGLTPARSGWVLAVVLVIGIIEVINYLEARERGENTVTYFESLEANRSNENRRLAEALRGCGETLGRIAERQQRQFSEDLDQMQTLIEDQ